MAYQQNWSGYWLLKYPNLSTNLRLLNDYGLTILIKKNNSLCACKLYLQNWKLYKYANQLSYFSACTEMGKVDSHACSISNFEDNAYVHISFIVFPKVLPHMIRHDLVDDMMLFGRIWSGHDVVGHNVVWPHVWPVA